MRSTSVVCGVGQCLAGAWADSASVELSDMLISVIVLSLTVIFLSVYPRNEPVCWSGGNCAVTYVSLAFGKGNTSVCEVIPADSAGQGCSSPNHAAARLHKCSVMRWILGAVRLQILLDEGICCSEGFGCATLLAVWAQMSFMPDSGGSQARTRRWLLLRMLRSSLLPSQG